MRRVVRAGLVVLGVTVLAASCGVSDGGDRPAGPSANAGGDTTACSSAPIASTAREVRGSGLAWIFGEDFPADFPAPLLDRGKIVAVLQADGIPAVDDPKCTPVAEVTTLSDDTPVVALEVNGDVRAYPLEILTWHELVNDTVGGVPITLSYCPLCNSAIAYDRRVGDRILDFGTSGALSQSSMVMYDRQSETIWTHYNGQAIAGELAGTQLSFFSSSVVSWGAFKEQFPDALVLSRDTGHNRNYGSNPYPGYEGVDDPFGRFITDEIDPRLEPMQRVIGIDVDGSSLAVVHDTVFESGVLDVELAGQRLTVWNMPGTSSALDGGSVSGGVDVGSSGVFVPTAAGSELTFARTDTGFVDEETGSTWNIFGVATAGPLAGEQLESVRHLDTFWFSWGTFFDSTGIVG